MVRMRAIVFVTTMVHRERPQMAVSKLLPMLPPSRQRPPVAATAVTNTVAYCPLRRGPVRTVRMSQTIWKTTPNWSSFCGMPLPGKPPRLWKSRSRCHRAATTTVHRMTLLFQNTTTSTIRSSFAPSLWIWGWIPSVCKGSKQPPGWLSILLSIAWTVCVTL